MIQKSSLLIVLILITCGSLSSCKQENTAAPISGEFVYHLSDKAVHQPPSGEPNFKVISESQVNLNGAIGSLQKLGSRYRITFEGENTEMFRIVKAGNKNGTSIWFWLEFTESGNCVIYSDTGANIFVKYQRPKQKT